MPQVNVTSSNIESVGYDSESLTLYVTFHKGSTYRYAGVPLEKYSALLSAPSIGKYLNKNIKGIYTATKQG